MWQYGETTEVGCSWSVASCDGAGDRTDEPIPHGCRPGGFRGQACAIVPGREPCCLCMVSLVESFPFIGSNRSAAYFEEYEETSYGVCGEF